MKRKIAILLIMIVTFVSVQNVKAEEDTTYYEYDTIQNNLIGQLDLTKGYELIKNKKEYEYYSIIFNNTPSGSYVNNYYINLWNGEPDSYTNYPESQQYGAEFNPEILSVFCNPECSSEYTTNSINMFSYGNYNLYDSNYNFISNNNFELKNFYQDNIIINIGDKIPLYKDLIKYNSWSEYEQEHLENYTEVNLDNYKYVLLTLKDYNKKDAFTTNLEVKGQVGITPIYNYGQTSKDAITGAKVQDRCNVNYENYTSYPLYILKQDLQNNAIYAVKECSQGSSFKYDNKIFDIFYVTEENENDPTVTINGQTYHTIPFKDLPSTANKNEKENYIPGQSGSINDTGGLDGAIKGIQQKMSEIWDTITYFTQFIGMIFSVFPEEIRIILLSSFTIAITIGLIKIFIK